MMRSVSVLASRWHLVRTFGLRATLQASAIRALKKVLIMEVCEVTVVDEHRRHDCPAGYRMTLLDGEEFAELAHLLLTHGYMNAETIRMDGAIRMAPQ